MSPGGVLPKSGVLLIGTERTVPHIAGVVDSLGEGTVLAGAVLVGRDQEAKGERTRAREIRGLSIVGGIDELTVLVPRLHLKLALVSVPAGDANLRQQIKAALGKAGLSARWISTAEELLGESGATQDNRPSALAPVASEPLANRWHATPAIDLGALIGRTPHRMDRAAIGRMLGGKRVLITGAGGSIGGELARVAAGFEPELLILMERGENALFEIDRQMARAFPGVARRAILHDVVDVEGTLRHAMDLRPQVVFHAAAHKHVPLMEDHPSHALTNNLFGTKSIADAAVEAGAERFVMISSDKAVNPTSVMGATKRLAEVYVHGLGAEAAGRGTRLSMVRFGNVLGSAASVLTIWGQQIAEGGPVTITDPRMTRYFMTIPEAATLVVQSAAFGEEERRAGMGRSTGGVGVFVLDMGEPIKIAELAARFVRAHGLWPRLRLDSGCGLDCGQVASLAAIFPPPTPGDAGAPTPGIDVVVTGARPGEKIHEELAYAAEALRPTDHPGVRTWAGPGFEPESAARVRELIAELGGVRLSRDRFTVLSAIRRWVPEMRPTDPPGHSATHPAAG